MHTVRQTARTLHDHDIKCSCDRVTNTQQSRKDRSAQPEKNANLLLLRGFDGSFISRLLSSGTLGISPLFLETFGWLDGLSGESGVLPSKPGSG